MEKNWTLRAMLEALGWSAARYAEATGQRFCTARGQVYENRIPAYPKPSRIKQRLSVANRQAGRPIPPEAIRSLWIRRARS